MYARRNHRLTQIMQLPMQDRTRAVYAFLQGATPFCSPAGRVERQSPWNPFDGLPDNLQATFRRAPLHALLVPKSYIAQEEAMSPFPHWMAAVTQAFSQWIESWVARDYLAFRERSRMVSAQSRATVRGTMVRGPDGQSEPWLQVFADHPAIGNIMGWPCEVLPVLHEPLCSLPLLAVATVLDVGALWLYDHQDPRVNSAVTERRSMDVLVGSKQLEQIQGDDAQGRVTEALFSLPEGDDNVAADARHTLTALGLATVAEAGSGGQRLVLASTRGPGLAGVDVIRYRTGLWVGASDERLTQPQGGAVAPAAGEPADDVERAADIQPGVHVERSETEPAPLCHCTSASGCVALPRGGVL